MHVLSEHGGINSSSSLVKYAKTVGWNWPIKPEDGMPDYGAEPFFRGRIKHPIIYGRVSLAEDVSVTAEIEFAVGIVPEACGEERHVALQSLYRDRHSCMHGPMFVRAREMPLRGKVAIHPYYTYRIGTSEVLRA